MIDLLLTMGVTAARRSFLQFAPVFGQVSEVDSAPFGVGKKFKTVSNVFLGEQSDAS